MVLAAGLLAALAALRGSAAQPATAPQEPLATTAAATPATEPASAPAYAAQAPPGAHVTDLGWFAPIKPAVPPPTLPEPVERVFVIPVEGPVTATLADTLARKIGLIRREGAELAIFRIDSPGGELEHMQRITRMITEDLQDVRTVAYVSPSAYSAAAIISLACDEIVMSPLGKIGDAMPISVGPQGLVEIPEKERGKIESALRSEIRSLAERNGYDQELCEGMVTITMELWLIRHRGSGQLKIVGAEEWRGRVLGEPKVSEPPRDSQWEYIRQVDGPMELVTLTASEAQFYGLSRGTFDNVEQVLRHYGAPGKPTVLTDVWSEQLVAFLTSPAVSGLLLMVAVISLYVELQHPGISVAGGLALACFAVLFGSRYLIGLAAWWEIAAFVLGLGLIAVEVFVIPGFGVAGVLGIILCLLGLMAMIIPNAPNELPIPRTRLDWDMFSESLMATCLAFIGAFVAIPILARVLPKMPLANRLVLMPPTGALGGSATEDAAVLTLQVGQVGMLESPCRPAGKARFGDHLVDVTTQGAFLAAGTRVRILDRQGNQVVVEAAEPPRMPGGNTA